MSEYDDIVDRQRLLLEAEEWSQGINSLHCHHLSSMWYDDRPQDTENGSVLDTIYNSGVIKREIVDTGEIIVWGKPLAGDDLIHSYTRHQQK